MKQLTENEKRALDMFKQLLMEQFPDEVHELKLFGSKARGEASKFSDVDVLVVMRKSGWRDRIKVHEAANRIFLKTDVDLSPKIFSDARVKELRSFGSAFIRNVEKDGIVI